MGFENVVKGLLTSILGAVMMGSAYYGWWSDGMSDWQAAVVGIIGFALLWMRDEIPAFIKEIGKAFIDRFKSKPQ